MLDQFQAAAEAVGATIKRFISKTEAVVYVKDLAAGAPVSASALPADIETAFAGTAFCAPPDHAHARVCVSSALAGIAATGSLLLELSAPTERGATALAVIHAVFLRESDIVPDLSALQPLLADRLASPTAYLSITTGPSRTADIERVLTIGVHGPKELHILVLEGA